MSLKAHPRFTARWLPHSQPLAESRNAAKATRASRGSFCRPLFSGGLSPVETILGESQGSGRRIGLNHDLRNGTLTLREKRGINVVTGPPSPIPDEGLFYAHSVQD